MAALHRTPTPRDRAEALNAAGTLFRAVFVEAWDALGQYGLSHDDRRDVAQSAVITALRRWDTYRQDVGSPRQWLRGIVRNEVRAFRRSKGEPPLRVDALVGMASEAATPEETVSDRDLLDQLLAELPHRQRQVVILYYLYRFTLEEIAALERTSVTRAHARRVAGMKALREAAARWKQEQEQLGVVPLPLSISGLFAAHHAPEPPADVQATVWRHVADELGLDDVPGNEPPESGPRCRESTSAERDPGLSRGWSERPRPTRLLRLLGLVGAGVLGVLPGMALGPLGLVPPRAEAFAATSPAVVATTAAGKGTVAKTNPAAPLPAAGIPEASPATPAPAATLGSVLPPKHENGRLRGEQAVMDKAHSALEAGNVEAALEAFAEHARRFPRGQNVGAREHLWTATCTRYRRAHARGDETGVAERLCAGR